MAEERNTPPGRRPRRDGRRNPSDGLSGGPQGVDDGVDGDSLPLVSDSDSDSSLGRGTAWIEAEERHAAASIGEDGLESLSDPSVDGLGDRPVGGGRPGWGVGVETTRHSARRVLPKDDVETLFKGGRSSGSVKTPFKEEDDNKEVKGCLIVLLLAAVAAGGWFLFDQFGGAGEKTSPVKRTAPPITQVEAIKEKTVVDTPRPSAPAALARKLVAPSDEPEGGTKGESDQQNLAAVLGMPGAEGEALDSMILSQEGVDVNSVCYNGQPARRVPSLYGLPGGFAITYALTPTGGPRLEFMPPTVDLSKDVLYYAAFGDPQVKGFEGNRSRTVPNRPAAIQRVILAWVAGIANGPCDSGTLP
ncbi:hypothetical protein [Rhodospirillum sp. A1_3_36]|uniref:hypothetical protein n=1 Tax=Rhodospirillum sp. A1_3_36 TaxID=3391666 RepID=UPI0039A5F8DD